MDIRYTQCNAQEPVEIIMIEAIVLAGGKGTRLGGISKDAPKPMLPVGGKPFVEYILAYLVEQNVGRVVLSVGHLADVVIRYFGNEFCGMVVDYAREDDVMGTGGAIRMSMDRITSQYAVVLNGDTIFKPDLSAMIGRHELMSACITMALRHEHERSRYGSVNLDGDKVIGFAEKKSTEGGLMNAGLYVINRDFAINHMPMKEHSFEQEILPEAIEMKCLYGYVGEGYFIDIGIPDDYMRANRELVNER